MSRYLTHFVGSVLILAALLALCNWSVDPYAIYSDREEMAEKVEPIPVMSERVFKTVGLAHTAAEVVFLGTSVTDIGIGREQPVFGSARMVNLATFGQPIGETRRLLEVVLQHGNPKLVVLGLDFLAFNALLPPPADFVEENYEAWRRYSLLLSVSTLSDSWRAMHRRNLSAGDCCYVDGFRMPQDMSGMAGHYHLQFAKNERVYLMEKYLPYPGCRFSMVKSDAVDAMRDMREIFKMAHRHHIKLHVFFSPSHARQWETLAAAGLWGDWEAWKRQLVTLNEKMAEEVNTRPFPLWDFSSYDAVSSEPVPASGDNQSIMQWYSDSAHYTPALGQRLVQRMFSKERDGWGTVLTSDNVEADLEQVRQARHSYRANHPQDIAEIEQLAVEVARVKHCPNAR